MDRRPAVWLRGVRTTARAVGVRTAFRVLDAVAPRVAGRWATRLWFTLPPRTDRRLVPTPRASGTPFAVPVGAGIVRATRSGAPHGPTALFVHGWGGSGRQFDAFVDPLVAEGWQVVVFDGPSHGASDPGRYGPRQSSAPELADALLAVAARVQPVTAVVAHSVGTQAVGDALRAGVLPERLVLIAPLAHIPTFVTGFTRALGGGERTRRCLQRGIEARVGRSLETFTLIPSPAPQLPLLVVADDADRETPLAGAERLVETWPGARLDRTSGLGHRRILADPAVVERVVAFLVEGGDADGRSGSAVSAAADGP